MEVIRKGSSAFRYLEVLLPAGESMVTEPGALVSCEPQINLESSINGGILKALIAKYLGNESFFINRLYHRDAQPRRLFLTQPTPGEIVECDLNGEIFLQPGAFIAQSGDITRSVRWAGLSSWLAGEGLFRLAFRGRGKLWYGCYGGVIEKQISGEYIVDSGFLLSYPPEIELSIKLSGGLISSFFGGEGFVLRLRGNGKVLLQTRSVSGLAAWLNPRFWG